MVILGINAYHGDASAAIVCDGQLVAAAEEERFARIKHVAGFPAQAIRYCLKAAGIKPYEIDHVAVARDPWARLLRKAWYAVQMPRLLKDRLGAQAKFAGIKKEISEALGMTSEDIKAELHRVEHHKAHMASSFFVSPFDEAALLSVDGLGDFASTMWGLGRGNRLSVEGAITFPQSLGIYYTAITQYLGFLKYGDEYKVMGLAAFGQPEFQHEFAKILRVDPAWTGYATDSARSSNGKSLRFNLSLNYFVHHKAGPEMTWKEGSPKLGTLYSEHLVSRLGPARVPGEPVDKRHENIAASLQAQLEAAILSLLNQLYRHHRLKRLCLAGGVAFNCVANGQILDRTPFEEVYIQPAAGDAGLAIGAAFYVWHHILGKPRSFEMKHAYWGPQFSDAELAQSLDTSRNEVEREGCAIWRIGSDELLCRYAAERIAAGKIVGWFQGRMEWGPRALGNRSIVVDPRRPEMKDILNRRIKHREPFRPFAPSILAERVGDYFAQTYPSPFMLMTYGVKPKSRKIIPAPTHVDGTGRLQTVSREQNLLYWCLIKEFENLTGVPVLLNTSFNDNEPIVCTPGQAIDCFLKTKMDALVMGKYVVERRCRD